MSGVFHLVWRVSRDPAVPVQVTYHLADDQGRTHELELDPESLRPFGGAVALNRRRVDVTAAQLSVAPGEGGGSRLRVLSLRPAGPAAASLVSAEQSGSRPYATVLCRFADSLSIMPHPAEFYQALLTGKEQDGLDHFWREVSDGRIDLSGSVVAGWVDLPKPRAFYFPNGLSGNPNWWTMVSDCLGAADATVDFRQYAGINMQFNLNMPASWGGSAFVTADGVNRVMPMTWMAPWAGHSVYAHEMGHSFGLPHSSGPYGSTYDSKWDVMSNSYIRMVDNQFIGQHTMIYHKNILGWIPASQRYVATPGSRQTLVLNQSELPGTTADYQMVQIPIPYGQFYTVEVRRRVGYDEGLPGEGVVIHRVDTTRPDRAAQVVDPDDNGNPNDAGAIWLPGERFTDPENDVGISVDAVAGTGFRVTVSLAAPVTLVSDSLRRTAVLEVEYADSLRADGGVGSYTWSVTAGSLPPGVALNAATGVLSGVPSQVGTWRFTARAASGSVSASREFRIEVLRPVRIATDPVRPAVRLGAVYLDSLRATGGSGSYTWSVAAGAVPAGLALDGSTGVLSGTATQEGTHRFTVVATSPPLSAALELVLRVAGPLAVESDSLRPAGVMGAAYLDSLRSRGGLAATVWRVTAGQLPAGVVLDSLSGALNGVPAEAGQFRVSVRARSGEETVDGVVRITVAKPQLQPGPVVDQLLAGSGLSADQARFLDLLGNRNGRVDVGDVRAWLMETQQMNLSEHPVLQQIAGERGEPAPAQPTTPGGRP
ncbi:MAG TPA: putative Ig domain-containing protein [Longimicrobium sp.]|nr:putative Ig domain-containing protein [Longimicrobium sp.]